MRLSLRKAARGSVTPASYTGNPGPSWAILSRPYGTDRDRPGELICFQRVRYKSGASDVQDSAAVAFESGEGVCQDHAHVYIASARAMGMPARYVSGYIYTGDANDAASHAWVDVWLGSELGWQSMDVTHTRPAVRTYCRLAVGRDYLDAAPVRGVRQGGGGEKMEANVLVAESAQQQQ